MNSINIEWLNMILKKCTKTFNFVVAKLKVKHTTSVRLMNSHNRERLDMKFSEFVDCGC